MSKIFLKQASIKIASFLMNLNSLGCKLKVAMQTILSMKLGSLLLGLER
jgi:hypothetical protein